MFASSVQSCCGEGGALQTDIAVCGEHSPVFRPHWVCPANGCLCFPVYTAQAPGCSIWGGPCVECGSSFWVLHNSADLVAPACCVFPGLSGSGSQRLARPLPSAARLFPPRPQHAPLIGCLRLGLFSGAGLQPRPSRWQILRNLQLLLNYKAAESPVCWGSLSEGLSLNCCH